MLGADAFLTKKKKNAKKNDRKCLIIISMYWKQVFVIMFTLQYLHTFNIIHAV